MNVAGKTSSAAIHVSGSKRMKSSRPSSSVPMAAGRINPMLQKKDGVRVVLGGTSGVAEIFSRSISAGATSISPSSAMDILGTERPMLRARLNVGRERRR